MYASSFRWKKSDKSNGPVHWTMRRSMRRKKSTPAPVQEQVVEEKAVEVVEEKRESITKRVSKRLSARLSRRSEAKREEVVAETKAGDARVLVQDTKVGNLKAVEVIDTESGARIKVLLHGGNLCSFRAADGKEKLFVSEEAKTDGSKPLRGGVPIVFPQFGSGPLPSHGFARTSTWELCDGEQAPHFADDMVHVALRLRSNAETLKVWPHEFELLHMIRFGATELETSMNITNLDSAPFDFQALLHTYLKVRDLGEVTVEGLRDHRMIDKLYHEDVEDGRQIFVEQAEKLGFQSETDSIYLAAGAQEPIVVTSPADNSRVEIHTALCRGQEMEDCDVVVWNPGMEKSRRLTDMGDEEYANMLCIEPGCASRTETCQPSETWTVTQNLKFSKISKYGRRSKTKM